MPVGKTFSPQEERYPGHIFILPREETPNSDAKDRGYVLLNRVTPPDVGSLVYRSSSPYESTRGAPFHPVRNTPAIAGRRAPLAKAEPELSYIYASRLLPWRSDRLATSIDVATRHLAGIRARTKEALGIGDGIYDPAARPETHRGKLARLTPAASELLRFRWGVVLTSHAYSRENRWQVLLPVFGPASRPHLHDHRIDSARPWIHAINAQWNAAVLSVTLIVSVSQLDEQIDQILDTTIDEADLHEAERLMSIRLGLPA